jgi:ABC-type molybdate transport system substrate-binding protein
LWCSFLSHCFISAIEVGYNLTRKNIHADQQQTFSVCLPLRYNLDTSLLFRASAVLKTAFLLGCLLPVWASAITPLRIGVAGGFHPTILSLASRISHHTQLPVQIDSVGIMPAYQQLEQGNSPYDLLILGDASKMQALGQSGQVLLQSIQTIAHSDVVLWCPNPAVTMRVALNDTINEPAVRRIAVSPANSPVGKIVAAIAHPSATTRWIRAEHALGAWRMARTGQADCAFTMLALMAPTDHYNTIPNQSLPLISAIPRRSPYASQAMMVIQLLQSPLIKARIISRGYH